MLKIMSDGAIKTKILYQANLSYSQLKTYLDFHKESDLIKEVGNKKRGKLFMTTYKGNLFLFRWTKILTLFEPDSLDEE